MVKVGDKVKWQGRETRVTSRAAAGRHIRWGLEDGRTVLDLEQKVASGQAEVVRERTVRTQPLRVETRDDTPVFGEDHED